MMMLPGGSIETGMPQRTNWSQSNSYGLGLFRHNHSLRSWLRKRFRRFQQLTEPRPTGADSLPRERYGLDCDTFRSLSAIWAGYSPIILKLAVQDFLYFRIRQVSERSRCIDSLNYICQSKQQFLLCRSDVLIAQYTLMF